MSDLGCQTRTQFIDSFFVIQYESSVMKILVDHNFDVITLIKQKSSKIMHVGHNYDSF